MEKGNIRNEKKICHNFTFFLHSTSSFLPRFSFCYCQKKLFSIEFQTGMSRRTLSRRLPTEPHTAEKSEWKKRNKNLSNFDTNEPHLLNILTKSFFFLKAIISDSIYNPISHATLAFFSTI